MDEFLVNAWTAILTLGVIFFIAYFVIYPLFDKRNVNNNNLDLNTLNKEKEEKERKEKIINRVFSYQYESLIYEIFSPYAEKKDINKVYGGRFSGQSWEVVKHLEDDFVKSEISRILSISSSEASELFNSFLEKKLLGRLWYKNKCSIGATLEKEWAIISRTDMNLSSWMESHHDIESVESIEKRRAPYSLLHFYRFQDFVDEHGSYEVYASSITSKDTFWIKFSDKTQVIFSLHGLGIKIETKYKNLREGEIYRKLQEIPNLYVMVDDQHRELILEEQINEITKRRY